MHDNVWNTVDWPHRPSVMFRVVTVGTVVALLYLPATTAAERGCDRHARPDESGHCRCEPGTSCVGARCSIAFAPGSMATKKLAVGCKYIPR